MYMSTINSLQTLLLPYSDEHLQYLTLILLVRLRRKKRKYKLFVRRRWFPKRDRHLVTPSPLAHHTASFLDYCNQRRVQDKVVVIVEDLEGRAVREEEAEQLTYSIGPSLFDYTGRVCSVTGQRSLGSSQSRYDHSHLSFLLGRTKQMEKGGAKMNSWRKKEQEREREEEEGKEGELDSS
tara:strand:- start:189 stop:728 length:540 start_codon:yes stop_codon:yes gene_type:complete